jgi:TrpR-related protein YerC/YecD
MGLPDKEQLHMLYQSLLSLESEAECRDYLQDLCTVQELISLSQRLEIARRLARGDSYLDTAEKTGASTATISRVNRCLAYGTGGYAKIIAKLPPLQDTDSRPERNGKGRSRGSAGTKK